MSTTPSVSVTFVDGQSSAAITLADQTCIKVGAASGGPFLTPVLCQTMQNVVSNFLHGPLVRSGGFHADYSGAFYAFRVLPSVAGTAGAVTKSPSATRSASLGTLTLANTTYTAHASVAAGAAINVTTGWTNPTAPLPLTITVGGGGAAHTQTVTGVNSAGATVSEVVTFAAAGTLSTVGHFAQVLSVVSNIDPGGASTYAYNFAGPQDRYNALLTITTGGVLGVSGGALPTATLSYDGGVTQSAPFKIATTGILELLSYAGGMTPQATGLTATLSAVSLAQSVPGAIVLLGADENGDVVLNCLTTGVTASVVAVGNNTALSVSVSTKAITVHAATDGMGAITSTGTLVAAAIAASGAAAALATAVAMGTGASLLVAVGSTAETNGIVNVTPKVEGVQVRFVNGGASQTHAVSTVITGTTTQVTLSVSTDAYGEQTTTATLAAGYLNADATASALLSAVAGGSGASVVGTGAGYVALQIHAATGDTFAFTTVPPTLSDSDVSAACAALLANSVWLSYFSVMHVVTPADDTMDNVLSTFVLNVQAQQYQYKTVVVEGTYQAATAETTWVNGLISTFATKSAYYGIAAGEVNCLCSAYGTVDRLNSATPYVARLMICPISESPAHVSCETILGTKTALDGVLWRPNPGDQPLWQSDSALTTLNTSNFITMRVFPGRSGVYVRQGLQFTSEGSDYEPVTNRRVANVAAQVAYNAALPFLQANLLPDPVTRFLAESECQRVERAVTGPLRVKLCGSDQGRQHCAGVSYVVTRGQVFSGVGQVNGNITITPRQLVNSITLPISFGPQSPANASG